MDDGAAIPTDSRIEVREIEEEMKSSYIDYAMSVIVGRALPDVRDGLKPVHRRILYAMQEMGMFPGRPFKKCARIVGEVLGKYHPHGDVAVYDTLVRMAQDFSLRYLLVDGHGNFGSVDGDSPAAMRYTEARLSRLATELLRDIDRDTVDFVPNFDDTLKEPSVLPARYPNLIVNGSSGIAVGMATNIPPHNLGETVEALIQTIDNPDVSLDELMKVIKGPDFPTGALIMGSQGIRDAYATGRGSITVRARAEIEETKGGRNRIVVTEIPYQVNKAKLTEKIAELVREKRLSEISDLRDESDRQGMQLVVELKRDAVPQVVLNKLYKHTALEINFGVNMLALVDGIPRVLNLQQLIQHYLEYQREVVTRRTRHELVESEEKAHILAGLLVAIANLDDVVQLIRSSGTVGEARTGLMKKFDLSERQAQAILDLRLQRLTALERGKIENDHRDLLKRIEELKAILADEGRLMGIVRTELLEIKKKYRDKRLTEIAPSAAEFDIEDLIAEEDMVVTITHSGYIKRAPVALYRLQHRGGKGVSGLSLKEGDFLEHMFTSSTHHFILFFTNRGKVYRLKVHELPSGARQARGQSIVNILPLSPEERLQAVFALPDFEQGKYLLMATKNGRIKKTPLEAFQISRREGKIAINLRDGDELMGVKLTSGQEEVILVTRAGKAIRFAEKDVRPMGRTAAGVKGISLKPRDEVIAAEILREAGELLVVTEEGRGKRTKLGQYPKQRRGGQGVITLKSGSGYLAGAKVVDEDDEVMVVSDSGQLINISVKGISRQGRSTQGVRMMNIGDEAQVSVLARVVRHVAEEEDPPEEA